MSAKERYAASIKAKALELGFDACGISAVRYLEEEAPRLEAWLKAGYHASMGWMEQHFEKRLDPAKLMPGAKSVVSVLLNYFPDPAHAQPADAPRISKYAFGTDYHYVIKEKLRLLLAHITAEVGEVEGRAFVDSAPVMDRVWAKEAGLGWMGKHSLLLRKGAGSFFFIGELILDVALESDGPVTDHCGSCTKCIDACPTEAIIQPFVVDANKCISHMTIELKDALPEAYRHQMDGWAFGCDVCQDVCPWNRFAKPHNTPAFAPTAGLLEMNTRDWEEITTSVFKKRFRSSPLMRTGKAGMQRNVQFIKPVNE
jgi:epoxyqueuosine reductase